MPGPRLILASASPRRQDLLREAGFDFDVDLVDIDESAFPASMLPSQVAVFLAEAKAKVAAPKHPDDVVLAADTVVSFGDHMLGKPADAAQARKMLELLAGTVHIVITGICVTRLATAFQKSARVMSAVKMLSLSADEMKRYLESNAWQGKAGGYGIQDADPFVTRQAGSKTNIIGLPMERTRLLLAEAGINPVR